MSARRPRAEPETKRREPADPPPYWWRRAEEKHLTMDLALVQDEPEDLDPRDLVGDETVPQVR